MKSALVTGHLGFVGRHVYAQLLADGWEVVGCDIREPRSGGDCRELFRESNYRHDLVVHCAAIVGGRLKIEGQPMEVATDLAIDSDFFQFVLRTQPNRAIYFSSSAAYPVSLQTRLFGTRLVESDIDPVRPALPDAVYGWVKLTGERLAQYANEAGANIHVVRPFSGYGSDQDLTYPFPAMIRRALRADPTFHVWGPGTQIRDWVHIDDVIDFLACLIDLDAADVGPVNICTGRGTSFIDLATAMMSQAGYEAPIFCDATKPVGVMHRVGDPAKMNEIRPARVSLEEGIGRALRAGRRD